MTRALEIRDLRKTYRGGVEALKGVSMEVEQGDFFALLGPNGAGKSTAIGIVTSLVRKTGGQVRVFGVDIDEDFPRARSMLGLVPQEFNFNQFEPVVEVVVNQAGYYGIPRHEAFRRAEHCLRQLGLWDKRREMSRNLSGGMKRRLMIARALVHRPRLLILDEPTAGVDIEIRRSMWEFLQRINADGTTIILTTHYLEEAESLCRHVAIINEGVVIENTSIRELLNKLRMETFILDLKAPLQALPDIGGYGRIELVDELTIEADVSREQSINHLFQELTRHGIEVLSMRNKANRLEQLFMHIVDRDNDTRADA